jgi:hypothetical protein
LASASAATYIITDRSVNPSIASLARLTTRPPHPYQLLHPGQFIGEQVQRPAELGLAEATVYRWKAQDLID